MYVPHSTDKKTVIISNEKTINGVTRNGARNENKKGRKNYLNLLGLAFKKKKL